MEGLLDAAGDIVRSLIAGSRATRFAEAECAKLARSSTRLALVLAQMQLCLRTEEHLRGRCTFDIGWRLPRGGDERRAAVVLLASRELQPSTLAPNHSEAVRLPFRRSGSKSVFLAVDSAVSALRQAEQLVSQVRRSRLRCGRKRS